MFERIRVQVLLSLLLVLLSTPSVTLAVEKLDLKTVLQRINATYPTLKIASKKVEKSLQDVISAESQLGWNLSAQGGIVHDLGSFNTITDTLNLRLNFTKQMESGSSLSIGSNLSNTDTDDSTIPDPPGNAFIADPSQALDFDLSYRMPFGKGDNNPMYEFALANSEAGVLMAKASKEASYDQIANQLIELYYATAQIQYQRNNAREALKRAEKQLAFMQKNKRLGMAEDRELLLSNAQLRAARLDLENANRMWSKQRTSLNRLMGTSWDNEFVLRIETPVIPAVDFKTMRSEIEKYSPAMKQNIAQKMMAEAAIKKAQNERLSQFDVIASIGSKARSGTYPSGAFNETGAAYSLRFEYQLPLDKSGFDAKLYQARIDHDIAEDNIHQLKEDIGYNLSALLAELESSEKALKHSNSRLKLEKERFQEVKQRYARGRADTSQIIMAEGELAFGKFSLQQQQIELAKRVIQLQVMRGTFWSAVTGLGE